MADSWAIIFRRGPDCPTNQEIVEAHGNAGAYNPANSLVTRLGDFSLFLFSCRETRDLVATENAVRVSCAGSEVTLDSHCARGDQDGAVIRSKIEHQLGHWNEAVITESEVVAYSGASGFRPLFYFESKDFVIVGTNPVAIRDAVCAEPELESIAAAYLISTTQVPEELNLYQGIKRVPLGCFLRIHATLGGEVKDAQADIFTPPQVANREEAQEYIRQFLPELLTQTHSVFLEESEIVVDITGGVDSRATLSLMIAAGIDLEKTEVRTFGDADNPEVPIAERVVASLGIGHRHVVRRGGKKQSISFSELRLRALASLAQSAGYRQGFDSGFVRSSSKAVGFLAVNGQAPDLVKGDLESAEAGLNIWLNRWCRFDKLGLLHPDMELRLRDHALRRMESFELSQSKNWRMWTFANDRKPNWGAVSFWNPYHRVASPFYHPQIARLFHSNLPLGNLAHYELIRACHPTLLNVPFGDKAWTGWAAEAAVEDDVTPPAPVPFDVQKVYPWQFDAFRRYQSRIITEILYFRGGLSSLISPNALDGESSIPNPNSADVKLLFALWGLAMLSGGLTIDELEKDLT